MPPYLSSTYNIYTKASKVNDIREAGSQVLTTLGDERLPTKVKVAQCVTGGTFMAARTAELTVAVPAVLPVINVVSTANDVGRTIIYDYSRGRREEDIVHRVSTKLLSGMGEIFLNIAAIPAIPFRLVFAAAGVLLTGTSYYSHFVNQPAPARGMFNLEGMRDE